MLTLRPTGQRCQWRVDSKQLKNIYIFQVDMKYFEQCKESIYKKKQLQR